jgi:hypothetical protein
MQSVLRNNIMKRLIMMIMLVSSPLLAHEMTPTYPNLLPSHIDGVYKARMEMFNRRQDVEYYEIGVFDKDFKAIPFVTTYKIIQLEYLGHVSFDVYIRGVDVPKATYVCSQSKLRKDGSTKTAVSSKICSKFK